MGKKTTATRQAKIIRVLNIDEIALEKGHGNFVLVLSAPEAREPLKGSRWVLVKNQANLNEKQQAKLVRWIDQIENLQVSAFQPFLVTLRNWFELILNYFLEPWTNAFAEGVNNKIKLIKRRAFETVRNIG